MLLVKQSANIALELTQRKPQFSERRSRINKHSNVVRNSVHAGVDVLVDRSYTDLQSVATVARGALLKTSSGRDQSTEGSFNHSQNTLSQLSLSRVDPNATDSALKVLRTTRGIFLEDHAIGHITVRWFLAILPSVVKIKVPWRVEFPLPDSKDASEKAQKVTRPSAIGTIIRFADFVLASYNTRLAARRCSRNWCLKLTNLGCQVWPGVYCSILKAATNLTQWLNFCLRRMILWLLSSTFGDVYGGNFLNIRILSHLNGPIIPSKVLHSTEFKLPLIVGSKIIDLSQPFNDFPKIFITPPNTIVDMQAQTSSHFRLAIRPGRDEAKNAARHRKVPLQNQVLPRFSEWSCTTGLVHQHAHRRPRSNCTDHRVPCQLLFAVLLVREDPIYGRPQLPSETLSKCQSWSTASHDWLPAAKSTAFHPWTTLGHLRKLMISVGLQSPKQQVWPWDAFRLCQELEVSKWESTYIAWFDHLSRFPGLPSEQFHDWPMRLSPFPLPFQTVSSHFPPGFSIGLQPVVFEHLSRDRPTPVFHDTLCSPDWWTINPYLPKTFFPGVYLTILDLVDFLHMHRTDNHVRLWLRLHPLLAHWGVWPICQGEDDQDWSVTSEDPPSGPVPNFQNWDRFWGRYGVAIPHWSRFLPPFLGLPLLQHPKHLDPRLLGPHYSH